MIKLTHIDKAYQSVLFSDLNYTFKENQVYLIIGENGTGKSVLLKMITGITQPDDGEIFIDNQKLYNDIDFITDAGVSINSDDFISYLDGYENLKLLININKKVPLSEIERYAEYFELQIHGLPYKEYSQGMKQKLRLIQAFIENPKYLLLDEPTNALDQKSVILLHDLCKKFMKQENRTIIFISHTSDKLIDLATKVLKIENCNLIEQ